MATRGDSGIGRAVALAIARVGADVQISYLNEEDAANSTRVVRQAGRLPVLVPGAIADPGHCRASIAKAVESLGRIDIFVNNAAFQRTHASLAVITTKDRIALISSTSR